jgi:hypothetical protein
VDSESSVRSWSSSWCCICSECCAEPRTCRNTRKIPSRHLGQLNSQVHDSFVAQAARLFSWTADRTRWQRALLTVPRHAAREKRDRASFQAAHVIAPVEMSGA